MSSTGRKSGKGTHGSLTKAGKVRHNAPLDISTLRRVNKSVMGKNKDTRTVTMVMHHRHKHDCPRVAKRRLAHLRMTKSEGGLDRKAGQWSPP